MKETIDEIKTVDNPGYDTVCRAFRVYSSFPGVRAS
jgi:hypothetical protein